METFLHSFVNRSSTTDHYHNAFSFSKLGPSFSLAELLLFSSLFVRKKEFHHDHRLHHITITNPKTQNTYCLEYNIKKKSIYTLVVCLSLNMKSTEMNSFFQHIIEHYGYNILVVYRPNIHCCTNPENKAILGDEHDLYYALKYAKQHLLLNEEWKRRGKSPFIGIGFSMGGNFLCRTAATFPSLFHSIALVVPMTAMSSMFAVQPHLSWIQHMGAKYLMKELNKTVFKQRELPTERIPFFSEIGNAHGYDTSEKLQQWLDLENYIKNIQIPMICIVDKQDPICLYNESFVTTCRQNPNIHVICTEKGNHGIHMKWSFRLKNPYQFSWAHKKSLQFLTHTLLQS